MDKHEALDWFLQRKHMQLDDKCQAAEDVAIDCIMQAIENCWISVKDRMPEEKTNPLTLDYCEVLCAVDFALGQDIRTYKFGGGHFWNGPEEMDRYVTHWMPLPEPPKEELQMHQGFLLKIHNQSRCEIVNLLNATNADASDDAVDAVLNRAAAVSYYQTVFTFSEIIDKITNIVRREGKTVEEALCRLETAYSYGRHGGRNDATD